MELVAINLALVCIKDEMYYDKSVVATDSKSVLNAMNKPKNEDQ